MRYDRTGGIKAYFMRLESIASKLRSLERTNIVCHSQLKDPAHKLLLRKFSNIFFIKK